MRRCGSCGSQRVFGRKLFVGKELGCVGRAPRDVSCWYNRTYKYFRNSLDIADDKSIIGSKEKNYVVQS